MQPFISICIPAYKNTAYLEVLLRSIASQEFKDHEVIITDDSPGNEVEELCRTYSARFPLQYKKNFPAKGSPANWNEAIRIAKGEWIKIMHDDDWFADEKSLGSFAEAAKSNPDKGFIFSGYSSFEKGKLKGTHIPGPFTEKRLRRSPLGLIAENYIGHPSTTLVRNDREDWYDEHIKWVVDLEYYIRCLGKTGFQIISKPLVHIGINEHQITSAAFGNRDVMIPEHIYLLDKMGEGILENIRIYDHYWRLFRNTGVRNIKEIEGYYAEKKVPDILVKMLKMQTKITLPILKVGVFSKLLMAISYYFNR
jgi:glycosyltransferase involved in cell wall biosynthesis